MTGDSAVTVTDALAPGSWEAPSPRPGLIERDDLVKPLLDGDEPLVTITAPAGYGKTTTMLLWDQIDPRPFAWVNLDPLDNDPAHLARHIGAALATVAPIEPAHARLLTSPGRSPERELMPAISAELRTHEPLVVVVDDVHVLTDTTSRRCLAWLVDAIDDRSTVALVGRSMPSIHLARRRLEGSVREVDAGMLSLSTDEARQLFRAMDLDLSSATIDELVDRTEGWAAGLHLAALRFGRSTTPGPGLPVTGRDRLVADYLVEEVLAALPDDEVRFLEESSILERMNPRLLDELLGTATSGAQLRGLAESGNRFLVPLDTERFWYRYHHLFGELLRARLREHDPIRFVDLHRRASRILERADDHDGALDHAVEAGDQERAATLVLSDAPRLVLGGRVGVLARRLDRLDVSDGGRTVAGALAEAWRGIGESDPVRARQQVEVACATGVEVLPDGVTTVPVAAACIRSIAATCGLRGIIEDTDLVIEAGSARMAPWWSIALTVRATALSMMGDIDEAVELFTQAAPGVADLPAFAAGLDAHLALIALHRDDLAAAEHHVRAARRVRARHDLEALTTAMVVFAADALVAARRGERHDARREAERAGALVERLDDVVPRSALLGHVVLARACLLIDDRSEARHHVEQADRARRREPDAARCNEELDAIHAILDVAGTAGALGPPLTDAELRLLPYLATHRSLKEIAADLVISRNTVKSHAVAIYRKLGATSRSEAVDRAIERGLLHAP